MFDKMTPIFLKGDGFTIVPEVQFGGYIENGIILKEIIELLKGITDRHQEFKSSRFIIDVPPYWDNTRMTFSSGEDSKYFILKGSIHFCEETSSLNIGLSSILKGKSCMDMSVSDLYEELDKKLLSGELLKGINPNRIQESTNILLEINESGKKVSIPMLKGYFEARDTNTLTYKMENYINRYTTVYGSPDDRNLYGNYTDVIS